MNKRKIKEGKESMLANINRSIKKLVLGKVKIGKTWYALQDTLKNKEGYLTVMLGTVSKLNKYQAQEQALEIGWEKEDIQLIHKLPKTSLYKNNLNGKLIIANLHEAYDTRLISCIKYAQKDGLKINFIEDEYDQTGALLNLKKAKARHSVVRTIYESLNEDDTTYYVSATNAVAYLSKLKFDSVHHTKPHKKGYFSPTDVEKRTVPYILYENWRNEKFTETDAAWVETLFDKYGRGLITITKNVNKPEGKKAKLYQDKIAEPLRKLGLNVVCNNSVDDPTNEALANADIIIGGHRYSRTALVEGIGWQMLDVGQTPVSSSLVQAVRVAGYRTSRPILFIPDEKKEMIEVACAIEDMLYDLPDEVWKNERPALELDRVKSLKILDTKFKGLEKFLVSAEPTVILKKKHYTGKLTEIYPLVDEVDKGFDGTREYDGRPLDVLIPTVINQPPQKKVRLQPKRRLFFKNSKGICTFPQKYEEGKWVRLGKYFEPSLVKAATLYIQKGVEMIALWDNLETLNEKEAYIINE